uniref:Glucan endo-1,3-beta-D-glucosidase n=1 Tax=Oryza meridionalis TaxID=40149 RepID=A0A0E0D0D6_9ORYZ
MPTFPFPTAQMNAEEEMESETGTTAVGVCWGMSGDNLPPASKVTEMLRENGFTVVRLYTPDSAALVALGSTGICVVVGAPNYDLPALAHGRTAATAAWIRENIQAYPTVLFRFVVVGNEVASADMQLLVPAMETSTPRSRRLVWDTSR